MLGVTMTPCRIPPRFRPLFGRQTWQKPIGIQCGSQHRVLASDSGTPIPWYRLGIHDLRRLEREQWHDDRDDRTGHLAHWASSENADRVQRSVGPSRAAFSGTGYSRAGRRRPPACGRSDGD